MDNRHESTDGDSADFLQCFGAGHQYHLDFLRIGSCRSPVCSFYNTLQQFFRNPLLGESTIGTTGTDEQFYLVGCGQLASVECMDFFRREIRMFNGIAGTNGYAMSATDAGVGIYFNAFILMKTE